jgi:hypothetical protein
MLSDNDLPLMAESVEQGNPNPQPEGTIDAPSEGLSSNGLSRESSISSHLDFRSVSVPSEERKEPAVPAFIPSPLSFENQSGGEGSRRSTSGLHWHQARQPDRRAGQGSFGKAGRPSKIGGPKSSVSSVVQQGALATQSRLKYLSSLAI